MYVHAKETWRRYFYTKVTYITAKKKKDAIPAKEM